MCGVAENMENNTSNEKRIPLLCPICDSLNFNMSLVLAYIQT
jgi:hypothetical protein